MPSLGIPSTDPTDNMRDVNYMSHDRWGLNHYIISVLITTTIKVVVKKIQVCIISLSITCNGGYHHLFSRSTTFYVMSLCFNHNP